MPRTASPTPASPATAPEPARVPSTLLTAAGVAERCGVSLRAVRRWIAAGDLAVHRLGRAIRVSEADLERFLAAHRSTIRPPPQHEQKAAQKRRKPRS